MDLPDFASVYQVPMPSAVPTIGPAPTQQANPVAVTAPAKKATDATMTSDRTAKIHIDGVSAEQIEAVIKKLSQPKAPNRVTLGKK